MVSTSLIQSNIVVDPSVILKSVKLDSVGLKSGKLDSIMLVSVDSSDVVNRSDGK